MFDCFQDYIASIKPDLDRAFNDHLLKLLGFLAPEDPNGVCGLTGGKKIRGALLCLVTASLGGHLPEALPRAVAVELIQTATLIHDDFVDGHRTRRRLPALWTLEGPRKAVLIGDLIFSSAIFMMSELGREDCRIVSRAIAHLSRGACQEPLDATALLLHLQNSRGSSDDYPKIIALKTGILFAAACELGAVAVNADKIMQQRWQRYGLKIGEAYQLSDDLHEITKVLNKEMLSIDDLLDLAPALLYFVPQSKSVVYEALRRPGKSLYNELGSIIREASLLMKADRDRKLQAASAELENISPGRPLLQLAQRTPADLVRIFDDTCSAEWEGRVYTET